MSVSEDFAGFSDASGSNNTMQYTQAEDLDMIILKRERDRVVQSLTRIDTFLAQYKESDFPELTPRLDLLNERWREFQALARNIGAKDYSEDNDVLYGEIEDKVMLLKGKLLGKLRAGAEIPSVKQERV